jgi:uncharacterized LabA/DUF88 family protein
MERVAVYIDGYNLYYGLREQYGRRYLWLDVEALSQELLRPFQRLVAVSYFTARVRHPSPSQQRQRLYLDALSTVAKVQIVEGYLQRNEVRCGTCRRTFSKFEEKKTDVNIACHMLDDAFNHRFDMALLISGDSDLSLPVSLIADRPNRRVVVAFPPRRTSEELRRVAYGATIRISEAMLRRSQLPSSIRIGSQTIIRPSRWS